MTVVIKPKGLVACVECGSRRCEWRVECNRHLCDSCYKFPSVAETLIRLTDIAVLRAMTGSDRYRLNRLQVRLR